MIDIDRVISENPLLRQFNTALGRSIEIEAIETQRGTWRDTTQVSLPSYLARSIRSQYMTKKNAGEKDVLLSTLLKDPSVAAEYFVQLDIIMKDLTAEWSETITLGLGDGNFFKYMAASSNLSEITKQQLLISAPVLGHPLSGGGHFVHESPPGGFSIPDDVSYVLGKWFAEKFNTLRKLEFTVPASTSQGLILKSRQDSPQWRVYSKALMAELAMRAKSRKDFESYAAALNLPFEERGFHGPAKDFYLGMRKQAARKGEIVGSLRSYDLTGDYAAQETVAVQGRLRGIFPPSEFSKIFFKPFAEGIKYDLFKKAACTFVDLSYISSKLHFIAYRTYFDNLLADDGTLLCFYDLDKMDTTTHGGFFSIYHQFCRGVFPDFDNVEGDMMKDSGILFPPSIYTEDIYYQQVDGRSTLSGQPDVTTKNNVCHLLAMSYCMGKVIDQDFEEVFKILCDGSAPLKNGIIPVLHLHGDDTMMYFSPRKEDYLSYYAILAEQGFETSCEKSPAFLKKTLCSFEVPMVDASSDAVISKQNEILRIKVSDKSADVSSILEDIFSSYGVAPTTSDYNKKYVGYMNPIVGSLVRNRCGEYEVKDVHLLLMALSDTSKMMDAIAPRIVKDYWHLIFKTVRHEYDLSLVQTDNAVDFFSLIQREDVNELVRTKLIELATESITKADIIKKTLEKMFYSGGEDLHDEFLQTIFGSLFVTNIQMSESFDLRSITTPQLIDMIQQYQRNLIDTSGICPEVDSAISDAANNILRVF